MGPTVLSRLSASVECGFFANDMFRRFSLHIIDLDGRQWKELEEEGGAARHLRVLGA
jgi:hypothetical protein